MGSIEQRNGWVHGSPLLTVKQAAGRLGLTEWQLRHSIEQGRVPAVRVSEHRLRVRAADVDAMLRGDGDARLAALAQTHSARVLRQDIERIAGLVSELATRAEALVALLEDAAGPGAGGEDHR